MNPQSVNEHRANTDEQLGSCSKLTNRKSTDRDEAYNEAHLERIARVNEPANGNDRHD